MQRFADQRIGIPGRDRTGRCGFRSIRKRSAETESVQSGSGVLRATWTLLPEHLPAEQRSLKQGTVDMKISVGVECTPEEARRFMGLPDLSGVHEIYVEKMRRMIEEGVTPDSISTLMQNWAPMGEASMNACGVGSLTRWAVHRRSDGPKMIGDDSTIFALSSGSPPAAIGVAIRISGPLAGAALEAMSGPLPAPRIAAVRWLVDARDGEQLDRSAGAVVSGPRTATGEDLAELHVHGGRAVVDAISVALGEVEGLRPAIAGEFTRRAFANGMIDLAAAEGLGDLLTAETEAQRRNAMALMGGVLSRKVEAWQTPDPRRPPPVSRHYSISATRMMSMRRARIKRARSLEPSSLTSKRCWPRAAGGAIEEMVSVSSWLDRPMPESRPCSTHLRGGMRRSSPTSQARPVI